MIRCKLRKPGHLIRIKSITSRVNIKFIKGQTKDLSFAPEWSTSKPPSKLA